MFSPRTVAVVLAALLAVSLFFVLKPESPDLDLRSEFPVGFHTGPRYFPGVAFDGSSTCTFDFGSDGIVRSLLPTVENLLAVNDLPQSYVLEGSPSEPAPYIHYPIEEYVGADGCTYRYEVGAWRFRQNVTNVRPVEIPDHVGGRHTYALTEVELRPFNSSVPAVWFSLEGSSSDPANLTLAYFLFPKGAYRPEAMIDSGMVTPMIHWDNRFIFAFAVDPASHMGKVELMLLPTRGDGLRAAPPDIAFERLLRLRQDQIRSTDALDPPELPLAQATVSQAPVLDGASTPGSAVSEKLGGAGSLILAAVGEEPLTIEGMEWWRVQEAPARQTKSLVRALRLQDGVDAAGLVTRYSWDATEKAPRLVVMRTAHLSGAGAARLLEEEASVSGTLLLLGADGATIAHDLGRGDTASMVRAARASLGALSKVDDLAAKTSTRLSAVTQRALPAAYVGELLFHLYETSSGSAIERVAGESAAVDAAIAGLVSLHPVGGRVVVAAEGVGWLAGELGLDELEAMKDAAKIRAKGFLGFRNPEDAKAAWSMTLDEVVYLASVEEIPILAVAQSSRTPAPSGVTLVLIAAVLALTRRLVFPPRSGEHRSPP